MRKELKRREGREGKREGCRREEKRREEKKREGKLGQVEKK